MIPKNIPFALREVLRLQEFKEADPVVYFLVQNDEVVYVGSTTQLEKRLVAHRNAKTCEFDRIFFVPVEEGADPLLVERRYIELFDPRHNERHAPSKGAKTKKIADILTFRPRPHIATMLSRACYGRPVSKVINHYLEVCLSRDGYGRNDQEASAASGAQEAQ